GHRRTQPGSVAREPARQSRVPCEIPLGLNVFPGNIGDEFRGGARQYPEGGRHGIPVLAGASPRSWAARHFVGGLNKERALNNSRENGLSFFRGVGACLGSGGFVARLSRTAAGPVEKDGQLFALFFFPFDELGECVAFAAEPAAAHVAAFLVHVFPEKGC